MKNNKLREFIHKKTKIQVQKNILFIYILFLLTGISFFYYFGYLITSDPVYISIDKYIYIDTIKTHDLFLHYMGEYESNNNYRSVNQLGYLGKYQFSINTLKMLKIKCTPQEFIDQSQLQEYAMEKYLRYNKNKLINYIGKYQFTYKYNIYITESGLLAAAHLCGQGNVKKFLDEGYEFKDANNTSIKTYLTLFSGYNLQFK